MNARMRMQVTRHVPLVNRRDGTVLGWRARVTLQIDDASGYADVLFRLPAPSPRRPEKWSRMEVDAFIQQAIRAAAPPAFQRLAQIVEERALVGIIEDFKFEGES